MARPLPSDEPRTPMRPATAEETRTASIAQVLEPGHDFNTVTDKITHVILRPGVQKGWAFWAKRSVTIAKHIIHHTKRSVKQANHNPKPTTLQNLSAAQLLTGS